MNTSPEAQGGTDPFRIDAPASLGAAIRHHRERAGVSQAQLAEQASPNRPYLSYLERGRKTVAGRVNILVAAPAVGMYHDS